jgi:RND superfamily putative drug exporter
MEDTQAASGAEIQHEAVQSIAFIKAYLEELSSQYPDVESEISYQSTRADIEGLESGLAQIQSMSPAQQQELMSALPGQIQQIASDLNSLADTFSGSSAFLFSTVLAQASEEPSPLEALKQQMVDLANDLQLLGRIFVENGNPIFISSTLMAASDQAQNLMQLFFSDSGQATRMYIVLNDYPQSDAALTTVSETREALRSSIETTSLKGAEVVIGGTSAELSDVRQILDEDFTRIIAVVLVAIFIVLALLLRSLVAPVYLLITVLLSYGTTLGIVSWIFQGILGQDGISFMIPILVFVLLVALGSDYNIFLMSRVKEESQNQNTRLGTRLAAIATGGVITACGIILAGTFGALVITPIRTLMQIGAAVSIGILIDTFIVRALLVPALASLLGRWNWWPKKV